MSKTRRVIVVLGLFAALLPSATVADRERDSDRARHAVERGEALALADILTRGRTSRLYRLLVRDKKLAVAVQGGSGLPGVKYPNLWLVLAVPARGVSNDAVRDVIRPELERMKNEDVTDEELTRFKTRAKADLIRSLNSNDGLAEQLVAYHTLFGDWRELFRYVDRMEAVTKADIRRVAAAAFRESNRTVGRIETAAATAPAPSR